MQYLKNKSSTYRINWLHRKLKIVSLTIKNLTNTESSKNYIFYAKIFLESVLSINCIEKFKIGIYSFFLIVITNIMIYRPIFILTKQMRFVRQTITWVTSAISWIFSNTATFRNCGTGDLLVYSGIGRVCNGLFEQ